MDALNRPDMEMDLQSLFSKRTVQVSEGEGRTTTKPSRSIVLTLVPAIVLLAGGVLMFLLALRILSPSGRDYLNSLVGQTQASIILVIASGVLLASPVFVMLSLLNSLRHETDLRREAEVDKERAERATRQSLLLQDILTHDLRNYLQVSVLKIESLRDQSNGSTNGLVAEELLKSMENTIELVERAKLLGRVLSERKTSLQPVNLVQSEQKAIEVVIAQYPKRKIVHELKVFVFSSGESSSGDAFVLADSLLDQVFLNLFNNALEATDSDEAYVGVDLRTEERREDSDPEASNASHRTTSYWKITITDKGRGIPDDQKKQLFVRYLSTAKGTGLGLSIVHALVAERYGGSIHVSDRVSGDSTKGAVFEILLPKA
jgi:signal transduction histidine kinase